MHGRVVSSLKYRVSEMMNYHGFEKHHYLERYGIKPILDILYLLFISLCSFFSVSHKKLVSVLHARASIRIP